MECITRFQPAKFGIKRKILKSCNSAEWFKTQQICVRKETSEIRASLALPKCTFCSVKLEQTAGALLSPPGAIDKSCSRWPPQLWRGRNWFSAPPRLWGSLQEHALPTSVGELKLLPTGASGENMLSPTGAVGESMLSAIAPTLGSKRRTLGEPVKRKFFSFLRAHESAEFLTIQPCCNFSRSFFWSEIWPV